MPTDDILNSAAILKVDRASRAFFTYVSDGVFDTWRSHANEVLARSRWSGDCDDLASTVLDILGRQGQPLDRRWRLLVSSARNGSVDHMIAATRDADGVFWVVGDTFAAAYRVDGLVHQPIQYQRMDEWEDGQPVWRDGAPWTTA